MRRNENLEPRSDSIGTEKVLVPLETGMCGIVGLFIKNARFQSELGAWLAATTSMLSSRGPDSAGFAVYTEESAGRLKLTLTSRVDGLDFDELGAELARALDTSVPVAHRHTHAVVAVPAHQVDYCRAWLAKNAPDVS